MAKLRNILLFFMLLLYISQARALFADICCSIGAFMQIVPHKTCIAAAALLCFVREFPHLHSRSSFNDGKCYSQYGTNTDFYVLHLHGWGVHAHAETFTEQDEGDVCIISPRFSETTRGKMFSTCLGQDYDALVTLQALQATHHKTHAINAVAHCRGAAVFFNAISILSTPDHPMLQKLNMSEEERLVILEKFKKGSSVIIAPLLSIKHFLHRWFTKPFGTLIHTYILPWLTRYEYDPAGMDVLKSLSGWNTNIPVQVIFPEHDNFIGTSLRKEFVDALYRYNGLSHTRIFVLEGETKHWPPFLKTMCYKLLFQLFGFRDQYDSKGSILNQKVAKGLLLSHTELIV